MFFLINHVFMDLALCMLHFPAGMGLGPLVPVLLAI